MASRKSSLTALSFNSGTQEPDNIILVKDNGLPANLTSKGVFGLALHWSRHGTTEINREPRGVELPGAPFL